jgi:hypothetical protein
MQKCRMQECRNGKWRMEDGGWKMENGGWRMEDGESKIV